MKITEKKLRKLIKNIINESYIKYNERKLDNAIPGKDFIHQMEAVMQDYRGDFDGLMHQLEMTYLDFTNNDYNGLEQIEDDIEKWAEAHWPWADKSRNL